MADVLWVDNVNSGGQTEFFARNGYSTTRMSQSAFMALTDDEILAAKVIYFPPNPSSTDRSNLVSNILPRLDGLMASSRLVVWLSTGDNNGNLADYGLGSPVPDYWNTSGSNGYLDPAHPLSTGGDWGGGTVTELGNWSSTYHGYFTDLPEGAKVVITSGAFQSGYNLLFEVAHGRGWFIEDGLTSKAGGWGAGNATFADNCAHYAISVYNSLPAFTGGGGSGGGAPDMLGIAGFGETIFGGGPSGGGGGSAGIIGDWFLGADMFGGGPGAGGDSGGGGAGVPDYSGRAVGDSTAVGALGITKLQSVAGSSVGHASVSGSLSLPVTALNANVVAGIQADKVTWTGGTDFDAATTVFGARIADSWAWEGSGYAHAHSGVSSYTISIEVRNAGSGVWETVYSASHTGTTNLSSISVTFAEQAIDAVRIGSSPHQNQTFHGVSGSMLLPTDTSVTGRLGIVIGDLKGLSGGGAVVEADLGHHLLQGGESHGGATVTEEFSLDVSLVPGAIDGSSVVAADLGITIWLAGDSVAESTASAYIGFIIDDLAGQASGESVASGDFDIHLLPPQPIVGTVSISATLNLNGEFEGFSQGSSEVVADPEVIYDLVATTSGGDVALAANLTRWAELGGGTISGESTVDASVTVYMLSGGLAEGESDVAARLYYVEGYVPLYAKPAGEATVVAHSTVRGFMRHQPLVGSATVVSTLYYLEILAGSPAAEATVTTLDFEIYTIPPSPIVCSSTVDDANLTGKFVYRGTMNCSSTVVLTSPLNIDTHFLPEASNGEATVKTGLFYVAPGDLLVDYIQCSTTFERVDFVRDVGLSAATSLYNDNYLELREDGEPIITYYKSEDAYKWGGVNNTGGPHARPGTVVNNAPLGMPIIIGVYTVDIVRGVSKVTVTQLIVNMGGQSNGQNRGTGELYVVKPTDLPPVLSEGSSHLEPVDLWPRGWLEPEPSNGSSGVGRYYEKGRNVHPFYGGDPKTGTVTSLHSWNRGPGYFVDSNLFHGVGMYASTSVVDDFYKAELPWLPPYPEYSPESAWIVPDYVDSKGEKRVHRYCGARFVSTLNGSNSVDLFVELKNALYGRPSGATSIVAEFIVLRFRTMMVEGNVARVGDRTRVHSGIVSKSDQPHIPLSQRRNVELDDQRHPVPLFT